MRYALQTRWKLESNRLVYFGLRNKEHLFDNERKIDKRQYEILCKLPCELEEKEKAVISNLTNEQIVVEESQVRVVPSSIKDARFCTSCACNDFIIPGVEFDNEGKCPICQTKDRLINLKGLNPIVNTFPKAKNSRFDVAVFYTGGKDSTYLLYHLSKVQKLRVLALTWEIPYMSDSAKRSIENAKRMLDNVEFITRRVANTELRKMYRRLYSLSGNTCACPSLAYCLFYPELVSNKVPYFVVGNEPSQIAGLYYNHFAPLFAYRFANNKLLNFLINVGRVLTLHPPLKKGQFQTLATMRTLAYGENIFKRWSGYKSEILSNVIEAMKEIEHLTKPLKSAIRRSSWTGNIPRFVQVDFDEIAGGVYDWKQVKSIIEKECGWVSPESTDKGLHTSCMIEKCKEYTQYKRFRDMKSTMIPFSALEISIASQNKCLTKEEAVREIELSLGFSTTEIPECEIMRRYLEDE